MRVRFTPAAEAELGDALDWYRINAPTAAARFLDELEALANRLAENPQQFPYPLRSISTAKALAETTAAAALPLHHRLYARLSPGSADGPPPAAARGR